MTRSTDAERGYKDRLAGYYDKWYRYNRPDGGALYDEGYRQGIQAAEREVVTIIPDLNACRPGR